MDCDVAGGVAAFAAVYESDDIFRMILRLSLFPAPFLSASMQIYTYTSRTCQRRPEHGTLSAVY